MLQGARHLCKYLCMLLVIISLTGCRADSLEGGGQIGTVEKNEPVRLVMWGGVPPEAGPAQVMETWNREHPDIQIEYVRYVNDDDGNLKLDTALLTSQQIDLYMNYTFSQLERRADTGVALDLSRFTDYDPVASLGINAEEWKVRDKYYGVPTKKNVFFVALNKEALEQAGLPIPKDWTWDELRMYAKLLSGNANYTYGLLQHLEPFTDPIDSILVHEGVTNMQGRSNMGHPRIAKWLSILQTMMEQDRSTPPYGEQITTKMPVEQMFLSGEGAMLNIGEWLFRSANNLIDYPRDFTIAFAPVPRMVEKADYATRGGLGDILSIHPNSPHIEAAWSFLQWYAEAGMIPMASGGRLPASKKADMNRAMEAFLGEHAELYDVKSLEYVLYDDDTPTYVRSVSQQMLDMRTEEYERFLLGDQTLEQTLDHMKMRHEALMNHE